MDVTNIEYRKGIEQNLAYGIWFMNTHLEDEYDEDFSWDKNCFPMEWGNGWCYPWYVMSITVVVSRSMDNSLLNNLKKNQKKYVRIVGSLEKYITMDGQNVFVLNVINNVNKENKNELYR